MIRRGSSVVIGAALLGLLTVSPSSAGATTPKLPDLGMERISDLIVATTASGSKQLRFSATIVNVGTGAFELNGTKNSDGAFAMAQRVYDSDGTSHDQTVSTPLVFGGDGHGHWHIKDLEIYELRRLDNGVKLGTGMKSGFCFFDTTKYRLSLAGAPQEAQYTAAGCGDADSTSIKMGVSVGWGDRYPWTLPDQYIDITGLDNGKYRLLATADPYGRFAESDHGNNSTWVDLSVSTRRGATSVKVLAWGPAA